MVKSPFPKLKLTVTNVYGHCYHGYKEGDVLIPEVLQPYMGGMEKISK